LKKEREGGKESEGEKLKKNKAKWRGESVGLRGVEEPGGGLTDWRRLGQASSDG